MKLTEKQWAAMEAVGRGEVFWHEASGFYQNTSNIHPNTLYLLEREDLICRGQKNLSFGYVEELTEFGQEMLHKYRLKRHFWR